MDEGQDFEWNLLDSLDWSAEEYEKERGFESDPQLTTSSRYSTCNEPTPWI